MVRTILRTGENTIKVIRKDIDGNILERSIIEKIGDKYNAIDIVNKEVIIITIKSIQDLYTKYRFDPEIILNWKISKVELDF